MKNLKRELLYKTAGALPAFPLSALNLDSVVSRFGSRREKVAAVGNVLESSGPDLHY
jgi:hypothetical protein